MVQPEASQYQTAPWQPTVDSSDSDEQQAATQYDDIYGGSPDTTPAPGGSGSGSSPSGPYQVPTLGMAYTKAPDLIPNAGAGTGSSSTQNSPVADGFSIDLRELMAAESSCLSAVSAAVDAYGTLAGVVNNAVGSASVFGQNVTTEVTGWTYVNGVTYAPPASNSNPDPLDSEGSDFAKSINPQMQQLLQAVGGAIEAMGVFTALLNDAGQMYAETDSQSAFPAP